MNSRPFTWDDVGALHDLVRSRWAVDDSREQMRIGDFYWTLRNVPEGDMLRHMRVWPGDDGPLAWCAWLDPPTADFIIAPGAGDAMFGAALDWIEREHAVAGSSALSIVVLENDRARAERLARRGYAPGDDGNVRFWQEIEAPPPPANLPDGFIVRGVSSNDDIARRAVVESTIYHDFMISADAWRSMTSRLPGYRPDLDVIAVADDGAGASACTCWYDAATKCGEFEAVGTSTAYRRMGLAKAVIIEELRRLHQLGATRAVVQTMISNAPAIALYQSCGFEVVGRDYGWAKANLRQ
jgi:ribosomal protein S18 acetylase RimI-like enzyme